MCKAIAIWEQTPAVPKVGQALADAKKTITRGAHPLLWEKGDCRCGFSLNEAQEGSVLLLLGFSPFSPLLTKQK